MGFFSNDCEGCHHPILSPPACEDRNGWMSRGVAIQRNGSVIIGTYDGYGCLDGRVALVDEATVYHEWCWEDAGKPTEFTGPSEGSSDQGWFFDDGVHNWASPSEASQNVNPEAPWRLEG